MPQRPTHAERSITASGLARLLARLDPDPDRAAQEYERLRLMLVKFFDWRGASPPDECADETIDRLAAKLEVGTTIDHVFRYAHGIARLVLMERARRQAQVPIEQTDPSRLRAAWPVTPTPPLRECFVRCLAALPDESRRLVLEYYDGAVGQKKIDDRERLARALGISDNALRSRVFRIRHRLERCTRACVAAADARGLDAALRHVTGVSDTSDEDS
jgi:DNA-directed RNA polymerase specialized sigma24 family protein